jgi:ABC-type glycerol-3-phosphate transport system substrate-binding protein
VQNISEIVPVHGVVVAAPFPAALQNYITYSGAVLKASTDPEAARAFLTEATSPANTARWAAAGFEPVPPAGR